MTVVYKTSGLFKSTFAQKQKQNPEIGKKVEDFLQFKSANPSKPYGSSDYPMIATGPIGRAIPKIRHAHLTKDLSVFYVISGADPVTIYLFAILTHHDSGTGNSPNVKTQKNIGKVFKSQTFG